ncbi:IS66 family insertion sequence element accessory protein TnpB [Pseudomonas corrugata]
MIRIDTALARVVAVFGAAKPHCAYLFANRRANRMKVLVHDGVGIWLDARRLQHGRSFWPGVRHGSEVELDAEQNFKPQYSVCPGNATMTEASSPCVNLCHGVLASAIDPSVCRC